MKKFLVILLLLGMAGYGLYYVGTDVASDKLVGSVSTELEDSGQMNKVKSFIENDSELMEMMKQAESVDESTLAFTSKGQATRVLIEKVGIAKLQDLQAKVKNGTATKEEVLQVLNENLTEEELLALQVIAYKEIYKK